jgi:hypothetical protein
MTATRRSIPIAALGGVVFPDWEIKSRTSSCAHTVGVWRDLQHGRESLQFDGLMIT